MTKSHNKKRNVGVVYELLLRRVSECLVNENTKDAQITLDILSKKFKKGTALYKEFRLFRALAKSQASDSDIAKAILCEAKSAARMTNIADLERLLVSGQATREKEATAAAATAAKAKEAMEALDAALSLIGSY